jgi:hypothetical protein
MSALVTGEDISDRSRLVPLIVIVGEFVGVSGWCKCKGSVSEGEVVSLGVGVGNSCCVEIGNYVDTTVAT